MSITQKSSSPLTPGTLNRFVIVNVNTIQRTHIVFVSEDSAFEAILENDTIFTLVTVF